MPDTTQHFLTLFTQVEKLVADAAGQPCGEGFVRNLNEASHKDRRFRGIKDALRACASLRNVLVHERYGTQYLAEPRQALVEQLERIIGNLKNPPKVLQKFKGDIREFLPDDRIDTVLTYTSTNDFSHVVVRCDGKLDLLSANTMQRWLAHHASQSLVELDVPVTQVLQHREQGVEELRLISRNTTLAEAQEIFYNGKADSLLALIVTERGKPEEKPLAFVTPWDLGQLAHILEE